MQNTLNVGIYKRYKRQLLISTLPILNSFLAHIFFPLLYKNYFRQSIAHPFYYSHLPIRCFMAENWNGGR